MLQTVSVKGICHDTQGQIQNGVEVPALGMGTWNMGDDVSLRSDEIASLQAGLDAGLRVIDTAEMYGNGRSESVVGEAIEKRRSDVFLVSKVLPSNASAKGVVRSCTDSLRGCGPITWISIFCTGREVCRLRKRLRLSRNYVIAA